MGNIASIANMLLKIGAPCVISRSEEQISAATKLILPGVGHFDRAMEQLEILGLKQVLNTKAIVEKTPVLGICLGMQLMGNKSEEGSLNGLGWVDVDFIKFKPEQAAYPITIPNMGWREVVSQKASKLFENMPEEPRFYFVHAYHAVCNNQADAWLNTTYGYDYVAAFEKQNLYGVQFHPEKSHKFGMQLLKNFTLL